jgi:probable rRNA maturation factor
LIEFDDRYGLEKFSLDSLQAIYNQLTKKPIELIFVNSKEMQELNKNFRQVDKTTDVLSFPLDFMDGFPLGSVVINIELAKNKAKEFSHSLDDEIKLMFIHGTLHLLGYDHEKDDGEMREKEIELIKKFELPKSLIIRSKGDS